METNLKEKIEPKGRIIVRSHPAGSVDRFKKMIEEAGIDPKKRLAVMEVIRSGKEVAVQENTIMQASNIGKDLLVQWLLGITTYPVGINYGALGIGITTPAVTDTQLTTEYARSTISFSQDSAFNEAVFQFFFTDSMLSNQTYYEFGTFVNATGVANSGQIFNHAIFSSPFVKTAGTDLTVEVDITLT